MKFIFKFMSICLLLCSVPCVNKFIHNNFKSKRLKTFKCMSTTTQFCNTVGGGKEKKKLAKSGECRQTQRGHTSVLIRLMICIGISWVKHAQFPVWFVDFTLFRNCTEELFGRWISPVQLLSP